jgi:hypothetical protein
MLFAPLRFIPLPADKVSSHMTAKHELDHVTDAIRTIFKNCETRPAYKSEYSSLSAVNPGFSRPPKKIERI